MIARSNAPSVERILVVLAFRQLLRGRRLLGAAVFVALPSLVALVLRGPPGAGGDPAQLVQLFTALLVPVVLPLAALVFGTAVFGSEIEDGTITFVVGKPVARWRIALARILGAALLTACVAVPSALSAGFVLTGGPGRDGLALGAALAAGGLVYCALFVAVSLTLRRALLAGFAYVLLWEGLLSDLFIGTRALSVRQYTLALAEALAGPDSPLQASLPGGTALVMGILVTTVASAVAIRRVQGFEISTLD